LTFGGCGVGHAHAQRGCAVIISCAQQRV
jgi:hypothetical protein